MFLGLGRPAYSLLHLPLRNHAGCAAECLGSDAEKTVLFPYMFNAKAWAGERGLCQTNVISFCARGAGYLALGDGGGRVEGGVGGGCLCGWM